MECECLHGYCVGFVEGDGGVSIEAAHAARNTSVDGLTWVELPGIGRTLSGVTPWPRGGADVNFTAGSGPSMYVPSPPLPLPLINLQTKLTANTTSSPSTPSPVPTTSPSPPSSLPPSTPSPSTDLSHSLFKSTPKLPRQTISSRLLCLDNYRLRGEVWMGSLRIVW